VVAFDQNEYRVVGIVRDTKHNSLRDPSVPFVFLPLRQALNAEHRITLSVASLALGGETALLEPVRRRVAEVDPGLMISEVISLRRQMDATLLTERLLSGLASVFGALAMLLAAVGLYGVLSYAVAQQRQLIGIRMALGATPSAAAGQVLRQSGLIVAAGMLCGLPFAAMAVRASDSLLWGVKAGDLEIYVAAVGVVVGVGLVSTWFPARTASSTEPAEALRYG
jgi:NADH:ubiquinone oxidoreductase subunit K